MTRQLSSLPTSLLEAKAVWGGSRRKEQTRACARAPIKGFQLLSSEEETRDQERGNAARERWGRCAGIPGERGKKVPPFLGMREGAKEQGLLVCPESHFHLTMSTSLSCLGGHLHELVRTTLHFQSPFFASLPMATAC